MDLRERITFEDDPVWTEKFERERGRVRDVSGDGLLGVFHVGSTAIPDVPGKPALDVLAVYEDYESMSAAAESLVDGEFELHSDDEDEELMLAIRWDDDHAVFVKMHTRDDPKARNQVMFREYLLDHPAAREEYAAVKREALDEHPEDPAAYTEAKSDVVSEILDRATDAGYDEQIPGYL